VTQYHGQLAKMVGSLEADSPRVSYQMALDSQRIDMFPFIGQDIKLEFAGEIHCQACDRLTKKSYSGGFCFPCSQTLAQCDLCIMKPETCHSNSSGLKVGITRGTQVPTRWIDQGATQALPIFRVKTRLQSGLVEVMFKSHVSDRTDWRKMLKGISEPIDLIAKRDELMAACHAEIAELQQQFGEDAIQALADEPVWDIDYPVQQYPEKVKSHNFDKTPEIGGVLQGIKGQYLILDTGVLNIRKFSGYHITMVTE